MQNLALQLVWLGLAAYLIPGIPPADHPPYLMVDGRYVMCLQTVVCKFSKIVNIYENSWGRYSSTVYNTFEKKWYVNCPRKKEMQVYCNACSLPFFLSFRMGRRCHPGSHPHWREGGCLTHFLAIAMIIKNKHGFITFFVFLLSWTLIYSMKCY